MYVTNAMIPIRIKKAGIIVKGASLIAPENNQPNIETIVKKYMKKSKHPKQLVPLDFITTAPELHRGHLRQPIIKNHPFYI